MIYTELTLRAMMLCLRAHRGQTDKAGLAYALHPLHLAEQMPDEVSCCVALLHDVVEDTQVELRELEASFPPEITDAVRLLTHEDGVDYMEYIRRLKENEIARRVKLADLAHNSDLTRLTAAGLVPAERDLERVRRYARAAKLLKLPT